MTTPIDATEADFIAPYNYRCSAAECNDIIVGYMVPDGRDSGSPVCVNHISSGHSFCFAMIGEQNPAYDPNSRISFGNNDGAINELLKQYRSVMINSVKTMSAVTDKRRQATHDLESFKEKVVEEVVGWDVGCREGKTEFLEALGLNWPSVEVTVTCTFSYKGDVDDLSSSEFEYALTSALEGDFENVYTEVDY